MENKKPMQHLKELYLLDCQRKYPNFPINSIPHYKYNDKTANGLTKCIIDFIELNGFQAERINNTGRQIDNRKVIKDALGNTRTIGTIKWIKGTGTNGTADISATINGLSVKVEVKKGSDKQSYYQKEYQKKIESSGGIYFIATSFEQFYNWFQKFI